jgi:hypothetical protein
VRGVAIERNIPPLESLLVFGGGGVERGRFSVEHIRKYNYGLRMFGESIRELRQREPHIFHADLFANC